MAQKTTDVVERNKLPKHIYGTNLGAGFREDWISDLTLANKVRIAVM